MRQRLLMPTIAMLVILPASAVVGQSSTAARVAVARPLDDQRVLLPERVLLPDSNHAHVPIWPFAIAGAAAGGVIAMTRYAHAVRATGDGDFAAPITIPLTLGIGLGLGAAGGAVVGQLVNVALR